ncbi:MAG: hypothetical protein CMG74_13145 [Candidatus Marinimicrobia bacterium]|nr:hypothetical protein [Candidatus Neomarinimicrobiota bacterium]|tara:strand:+ start:56851 stop:57771 length:921 start_codon:yes stop_codon:yes gene_type:complete
MKKSKVLISTSSIAQKTIDTLSNSSFDIVINKYGKKLTVDQLLELGYGCNGIIAGLEKYSSKVINKLPELKVISRLGIGTDNIDIKAAKQNGIKIYTTSSPAPAVAELALGLMIDLARNISLSNNSIKNQSWEKNIGSLLKNKTLGIIGMGSIGKELVKLVEGFNFRILAYDKVIDENFKIKYNIEYSALNTLLRKSDIISIHLNSNEKTHNLINKKKLKLINSTSYLINTSRGEIIDEDALYESLKENRIAGAGIDVFNKEPYFGPLTKLNNVVLTPHIGSYAKETRKIMETEAVNNLIKGLNEI